MEGRRRDRSLWVVVNLIAFFRAGFVCVLLRSCTLFGCYG